jgi:hypothetical protein
LPGPPAAAETLTGLEPCVSGRRGAVPVLRLSPTGTIQPDQSPLRRLVYVVLLRALADGATAIRFRPDSDGLHIEFLRHGVWHEPVPPPEHLAGPLAQVLRVTAGLYDGDLSSPRSGPLRLEIADCAADLSVSVEPAGPPAGPNAGIVVERSTIEPATVSFYQSGVGISDEGSSFRD